MLDRECKNDVPALVTKVSRRQKRETKEPSNDSESSSAAVIIRRNSSAENKKLEEQKQNLPYVEVYNEQKKARNPYFCVPCNKKFAKSSLNTHVKSKHRGRPTKVKCTLCEKVFEKHTKATEHVNSEHKVYPCKVCKDTFSEFDKLKAHLKAGHDNTEWPWICGFCDLVLLYDLEFEVHIKQHTDRPPFACPLCDRLFSDNSRLREHLARQHLPSKNCEINAGEKSLAQIKFEKSQEVLAQQQVQAFEKLRSFAKMTDKKGQKSEVKDEVSRELAALLLNLHDNGNARPPIKQDSVPKAEDLSLKNSVETAIDLTKSKPEITLTPTMPASITKLVKGQMPSNSTPSSSTGGVTVTKTSVKAPTYPAASNATSLYPFYPSLASMTSLSPTLAMNSSYLLHNLLLGKVQQIANSSSTTSSTTASTSASNSTSNSANMAALPTHPLPAQTLSLPASKPPASVLKSATSPPLVSASSSSPGHYNLQLSENNTSSTSTSTSASNSIDIPYMCRQIVTLLNGLLFHQHNLNNPTVEMNVHTQLGAIYTRLQEVVVMVEQAKKQQEAAASAQAQAAAAAAAAAASVKAIGKKAEAEKHLKDSKQKEEEKIAKHIHEYQRALLKQHSEAALASTGKENLTHESMANLLKKQNLEAAAQAVVQQHEVDSMEESEAALKNRRRGRPPKNSNMDLSYSPPEKKMRPNAADIQPSHQQPESSTKFTNGEGVASPSVAAAVAAAVNLNGHVTPSNSGSKGGKGIRNRVFCGECTGCLKNDDCGKCRYCKDKTKFGGQNRLRQKCLHRRCQLDTHRRRSSQNTQNAQASAVSTSGNSSFAENLASATNLSRQSPSPDTIYSGVALARLASQNLVVDNAASQEKASLSPGEIIRTSGQPVFPQATAQRPEQEDARSKTMASTAENPIGLGLNLRAQQRSGSSASNASDEDTDGDHKSGGRSQSRIDKWKAKHEAMLKMASKDKQAKMEAEKAASAASDKASASSEDETEIKANGVCINLGKPSAGPPAASLAAPPALSVK